MKKFEFKIPVKIAFIILGFFCIIALLSKLGIIGTNWSEISGSSYEPPSFNNFLGTDIFGISVVYKIIKGAEHAISIGFIVGIISIFVGVLLGAISGYFGGIIDQIVIWFYSTISSIPNIMLFIAITFVLGKGLFAVYIALGSTLWVEICRIIRAEVVKNKNKEYVGAAIAIGATNSQIILKHILPNLYHIILIQFSSVFQMAVLSEIILSFLGIGVQNSTSWGIMINDSKIEMLKGVWWQLTFSSIAIFLVIFSFNIIIDELKDSLERKLLLNNEK